MADLEFPNGALVTGVEAAFGADIYGDQDAWPWVSLTAALMDQTVSKTRGRSDESSDVAPTAAGLELDNPEGDLTPDNASGAHYPNVDLGTPFRWWIEVGLPRLYLRPERISSAEIASSAALDLAGDLDVRIDMHLKSMDPSGVPAVVVGRADDSNPYSWRLAVHPDRTVTLFWSATGTTPPLSITSTVPVVPMSARATLRVTLDVNNGAAGRTATFYVGESVAGPFTQVGPAVIQAGATSIANVSEPLVVGSAADLPVANAPDADVYAFQLLDGIGGSALADADFTAQVSGTGSFVDSAGRTWDIFNAELSNRWFRMVGTGDEWAPTWPWGDLSSQIPGGLTEGQARVDVAISGILRRLGQGATPLDSALRRAITARSDVIAYWPMEDESGAATLASGIPGRPAMTFSGAINLASDSTLPGSKPLPELTGSTGLSGAIVGNFNGTWQVDWYINSETGPALPTAVMAVSVAPGAAATIWLVQISAAAVTVTGYAPNGSVFVTTSATPTDMFGGWVHLRLAMWASGADVHMRLTWEKVTYPASTAYSLTSTTAGVLGNPVSLSIAPYVLLDGIATGHWSVSRVFDADLVGNAATGWLGETAADRMARLFAEEGVAFRVIGDPSTTERMGSQQPATLLTLADDAENADGGVLYEMPDAVGLLYRTRESLYNQPPNMVLDAHLMQMQNPFLPILDDQRVTNVATVTRVGGSSFTAVDEASVAKRGTYPDGKTLNLYQDSQNQSAAGWMLHQGIVKGMRYPSLVTDLGEAPEKVAEWLTVDQGARVHVLNLPPQHPAGPVKVMVEGYGEPISPATWVPAMNCSPAGVWDVGVIDDGAGNVDDLYLLRLETDGSQLAESIDAVDTTFQVSVTAGPLWVTDAAEFPFDINIGGERMTVSDIDAVTGGEEFTGAGSAAIVAATSHVAPSVVAVASGDLLICAWQSFDLPGALYTPPGTMTGDPPTTGTQSKMLTARQTLGAAGATGTRTATYGSADTYSAITVAVHAGTGSPTVVDYASGVASGAEETLTTGVPAAPGDWLLAINGWDWDPGNIMASPGDGWIAVADSTLASSLTSRTRVWAKRVAVAGIQSVTFVTGGGINDNHGRLYLISGLVGPTQLFTVARSANGVVKSHAVTAGVTLWNTPVLAR
jgi:hypothetical protein